jgi:hypothetical protein
MEDQYSGPTTTANSKSEGRLVVGAGCQHKKKKCLKCAVKDGKGGVREPGYGKPPSPPCPKFSLAGLKVKKKKPSFKTKKSKFSSSLKSSKKSSLKRMLRKLK